MFDWLRRWRQGSSSRHRVEPREPAQKVDPIEELLRIVNGAQHLDAEGERRLGNPTWRDWRSSYPERNTRPPSS